MSKLLPNLGLGTAQLGNWPTEKSEADAVAIVEAAYHHGIRYFDTAPYYDHHLSEQRLGIALASLPKKDVMLSTKVGRVFDDNGTPTFDFSRDGIMYSLTHSLKRLNVDHVEIAFLHDPEPEHYAIILAEALPTLKQLQTEGVIGRVGLGVNEVQSVEFFLEHNVLDVVMLAGRYTLLDQTGLSTLNKLVAHNVPMIGAGVYNSGILADATATYNYHSAPDEISQRRRHIAALCARYEVSIAAVAQKIVLAHPAVSRIVLGAERAQHVISNIEAYHQPIPTGLWEDMRQSSFLGNSVPLPSSG